jgi:hypothetical protein
VSSRYQVWLVDDREENRRNFEQRHGDEWDVKTFERPNDVLAALSGGPSPDALVCDIYYYDDPVKREEVEALVKSKAQELRELASELDAGKAQKGVGLIENVQARFGGRPKFPVFAYTSKGAYLLQNSAYDQLEAAGARWLFKGKYSPQNERSVVNRAVQEVKFHELRRRIARIVLATAVISAVAGALLGMLFGHLTHVWWGW